MLSVRFRKKSAVWGLLFTSLFLFLLFCAFGEVPGFADAYAAVAAPRVRSVLSGFFSLFPFSLTALALLCLPMLFLFLLVRGMRALSRPGGLWRYTAGILSAVLAFLYVFVTAFAAGYRTTPLGKKLLLSPRTPDGETLARCTAYLSAMAVPPDQTPGNEEWLPALQKGFSKVFALYGFPEQTAPPLKISRSGVLSFFGILGLYTLPFGEVTVNGAYPDALFCFTAAHETAHGYGFAREEEADLMAFLACEASENAYLCYAAAVGMLGRILPVLRDTDPAAWQDVAGILPEKARAELSDANRAYSESVLPASAGESGEDEYRSLPALLCAYLSGRGLLRPPTDIPSSAR